MVYLYINLIQSVCDRDWVKNLALLDIGSKLQLYTMHSFWPPCLSSIH